MTANIVAGFAVNAACTAIGFVVHHLMIRRHIDRVTGRQTTEILLRETGPEPGRGNDEGRPPHGGT